MILHVAFGAGHKERVGDMKCMQSAKIDIASIHYIDGSGLRCDQIQRQRIAHFTVGNVDKAGDGATQIEQCMHFDGSFGATKISPRKQSETQIYRSAVECMDCVVKIKPDIVIGIKIAGSTDQDRCKIMPMRQSRSSLASARVDLATGLRNPIP